MKEEKQPSLFNWSNPSPVSSGAHPFACGIQPSLKLGQAAPAAAFVGMAIKSLLSYVQPPPFGECETEAEREEMRRTHWEPEDLALWLAEQRRLIRCGMKGRESYNQLEWCMIMGWKVEDGIFVDPSESDEPF
jgi:hypothetical protein